VVSLSAIPTYISFKAISSKNNLIIVSFKLEVVMLKVNIILYKESLKGFLISLIGAGLVYLKSPDLLEYIEIYNFLLKLANLFTHFLNRVSLKLGTLEGNRS
jgi:hypothetical protein